MKLIVMVRVPDFRVLLRQTSLLLHREEITHAIFMYIFSCSSRLIWFKSVVRELVSSQRHRPSIVYMHMLGTR